MYVMKGSELEINSTLTTGDKLGPFDRVRVEVKEVWVEVEDGKIIPWVSTVVKDALNFPYTFRLTLENIANRNITFIS